VKDKKSTGDQRSQGRKIRAVQNFVLDLKSKRGSGPVLSD
jgi:hypothetical protein